MIVSASQARWTTKPLRDIATIDRRIVDPTTLPHGTRYVGLEHIDGEGQFVGEKLVGPTDLASAKFVFGPHHVLFGKLRPYLKKTAVPSFQGVCSTDILPIRPSPSLSREYLYHYLRVPSVVAFITSRCSGTNLPRISPTQLEELAIPLPHAEDPPRSLAVQKRVAAVLNKAEAIRSSRRAVREISSSLPTAIFYELFGDPTVNKGNWPIRRLEELVMPGDSINYGVVQPGEDVSGGVPIVRVGDFRDMRIRKEQLKRIAPSVEAQYARSRLVGDEVLVACVGSIGAIALADESLRGFNIVRAVARIRCGPDLNRVFLAHLLATPHVQRSFARETRTVSQPTLNIRQIEATEVIVPPLSMQREFAKRALAVSLMHDNQSLATLDADRLFQSLVDRAFGGGL